MSVQFEDYYDVLGVERSASQDEIAKAYKKLARKHHPDLNPGNASSEDRFKKVGEAYEVLKDPDKRKRYDALGANWKHGQDFTPPPGWDGGASGGNPFGGMGGNPFGGGGFRAQYGGGGADFSDFFNMFFGGAGGPGGPGGRRAGGPAGFSENMVQRDGQDQEIELEIDLEDIYHSVRKNVALRVQEQDPRTGQIKSSNQNLTVNIPAGTTDGKVLRLAGQGAPGVNGGRDGALLLRIKVRPHPLFQVDDHDLTVQVTVSPWEAALGSRVPVKTMDGEVTMTVPAGVQGGQKLRLRGKGLPVRKDQRGDLFAEVRIAVPKHLSDEERELFERLATVSGFDPRA